MAKRILWACAFLMTGCSQFLGIEDLPPLPEADGGALDASDPLPATDSRPLDASPIDAANPLCPTELIAWWRAENDALDATGNGFDAELYNNAQPFADGKIGRAFHFDGIDDYLLVQYDAALYPDTASFSIEAWIRTTDPDGMIIHLYECGGTCVSGVSAGLIALFVLDGALNFSVQNNTGTLQNIGSTSQINDGAYHHVVAVRNVEEQLFQIFIDGQLSVSTNLTVAGRLLPTADGDADPFTIGAGRQGNSSSIINFLEGDIDELSYYLRALSPAEVTNLATNGKCETDPFSADAPKSLSTNSREAVFGRRARFWRGTGLHQRSPWSK